VIHTLFEGPVLEPVEAFATIETERFGRFRPFGRPRTIAETGGSLSNFAT
jgi:hypothetical protein